MITLRTLSQDNPDILLVKELYIQAFPPKGALGFTLFVRGDAGDAVGQE